MGSPKFALDRILGQFKKYSHGVAESMDMMLYKEFIDIELTEFTKQLQMLPSHIIGKLLKNLKENGLNLNIGSIDSNSTILHAACTLSMGHIIIKELLKLGADVNIKNNELELPVHIAIKHDNSNCIAELVGHESSLIHVTDKNGFGLIHKAAHHLAVESIQMIVNLDPNCVDTFPKHK